ncbi:hypothetical protein JKP88DRAFT_161866 [Tribonema minus]|uniref:Uncharacterized protein n=1 Tax=Tribonema minus TaxID=303371 RepID=A0A835Z7I5_9STRA|nr:hypothetical protein JKP88DRAFT_161866 [Tribonema minus]
MTCLPPLPHTLRELDMSGTFMEPPPGPLPPHLTSLSMSNGSDLALGELPFTLEKLHMSAAYNEPLGPLPASLVEITTSDRSEDGAEFDQSFGELPRGLQVLDLLEFHAFNHDLGALPAHLVMLTLGCQFNQHLGVLPDTLEVLVFYDGDDDSIFDQPLGPLPQSLRKLHLSSAFNQALGLLPPRLEYLECVEYNHSLAPLPLTLQHLLIWNAAYNHDLGALPPSLVELRIHPAEPGEQGAYTHRLQPIHPALKAVAISRDYAYLDDLAGVELAHNGMWR